MIQRVKDKLSDNSGVTILMALFALLVAAMVSVVILGASVTTVKQAKTEQEQEQNTLILQSAGDLIVSNICDADKTSCSSEVTETRTTFADNSSTSSFSHKPSSVSAGCIIQSDLEDAMDTLIDGYWDGTHKSGSGSFVIDATATKAGESVPELNEKVRVEFECHDSYTTTNTNFTSQLVCALTLLTDDDKPVQTIYLKMKMGRAGSTSDSTTTNKYENDDPNQALLSTTTTTRITYTYTWSNPVYYLASEVGQ